MVEEVKTALSNNILKQQAMPLHGKKVGIKTADFVPQIKKQDPQLTALDAKLAHQTAAYQQKLKQLKAEMLVDAKQKAAEIKQEAYDSGYAQGKKDGYQEAVTKGQQKMAPLVKQAQDNVEQSLAESKQYLAEKKDEITSFAVQLAEIILKTQLELTPEKITAILSPLLFELEKPNEVLMVWANSAYHESLTTKLEQVKEEIPDLRYIIFDDDSLNALQLRVESNESVVDIDIKKELQGFLEQL